MTSMSPLDGTRRASTDVNHWIYIAKHPLARTVLMLTARAVTYLVASGGTRPRGAALGSSSNPFQDASLTYRSFLSLTWHPSGPVAELDRGALPLLGSRHVAFCPMNKQA